MALHIRLVTISAVPIVSIAFDSQPRLPALDHEVNSFPCNFMLGKHCEILAKELQGNINLEPAFKGRGRTHNAPIVLGSPPLQFVPLNSGNLWRL